MNTSQQQQQLHHHHAHHHQHHHHHGHHQNDVHQQRLLWFFSFCNQRSSGSSSSSSSSSGSSSCGGGGGGGGGNFGSLSNNLTLSLRRSSNRRKSQANRNKFAIQYQQQLQKQQTQVSNVFGCDLIEHANLFSSNDSIPNIVKTCTKFIEQNGIIFGIYRLSGMRVNISKLRLEFDKNPKISIIDGDTIANDAHAVACVLKQYFRELPTPLLTFHMYEKFIELFKQSNTNINTITTTTTTATTATTSENQLIRDKNHRLIEHDNIGAANPSPAIATSICDQTKMPTSTPSTTSSTPTNLAAKSKSLIDPTSKAPSTTAAQERAKKPTQITTSVSDSQLISLSSVVATTSSDIKYQVKLVDLKKLLLQLPKAHYQTLRFLMRHLACIAANGRKTGMDSKNVAIVWAPNLLKPRELELSAGLETLQIIGLQAVITEQLIKHHEFLFDFDEADKIQKIDEEEQLDHEKDAERLSKDKKIEHQDVEVMDKAKSQLDEARQPDNSDDATSIDQKEKTRLICNENEDQ